MSAKGDLDTDVAIVGGGLAGLALASLLQQAGVRFELFEARPRFGGRIAAMDVSGFRTDLGPSWFWPGQPRMARLVTDLGLRAFPQHAVGDILFEDAQGAVHRGAGFGSMEGSFRVDGGMLGLIEGLVAGLPADRLHVSSMVEKVGDGLVRLSNGSACSAEHIVLAVPPRLAAGLQYRPTLPVEALNCLAAVPTWMAGHAKFVAVYDRPFWRDKGFSGDAMSRLGPLAEIHDASGPSGTPAALFGFLGLSAPHRRQYAHEIEGLALGQLERIFGPEAARPTQTAFVDWTRDPLTATHADETPTAGHPDYGLPNALGRLWGGRLHFAATETAPEMGGLMEGALASAERVARGILADLVRR